MLKNLEKCIKALLISNQWFGFKKKLFSAVIIAFTNILFEETCRPHNFPLSHNNLFYYYFFIDVMTTNLLSFTDTGLANFCKCNFDCVFDYKWKKQFKSVNIYLKLHAQ